MIKTGTDRFTRTTEPVAERLIRTSTEWTRLPTRTAVFVTPCGYAERSA